MPVSDFDRIYDQKDSLQSNATASEAAILSSVSLQAKQSLSAITGGAGNPDCIASLAMTHAVGFGLLAPKVRRCLAHACRSEMLTFHDPFGGVAVALVYRVPVDKALRLLAPQSRYRFAG